MPQPSFARTHTHEQGYDALLKADFVCPHTDADGLAAGAMALRARGQSADDAVLLSRGTNPWQADILPDGYAAVLDQGLRATRRAMLVIDHHVPEAEPGPNILYVGPEPDEASQGGQGVSTAVLMRRVVPDAPAWLAAVGAAGDYGDLGLKQPECHGVVKTHVRKLVTLINAPRRTPDEDAVRVALALLVEAADPKAALADPRVAVLEACKADYKDALAVAMKAPPKIVGGVALVRISSAYQVHPLVSQTWLRRLSPNIVMCANDGYVPGMVHFACRGGPAGKDLRAFLRDALPDATGEFGHGHAGATGGSIAASEFARLLAALGLEGVT